MEHMTPTPEHELKSCPFCAGAAEWNTGRKGDDTPWHYIACSECEAMGSCNSDQREGQILDWNTRAEQPDVSGLDKLCDILKKMAFQKTTAELRESWGDEWEGDMDHAYDWFCDKSREALAAAEEFRRKK